jgi:hypothetical protein
MEKKHLKQIVLEKIAAGATDAGLAFNEISAAWPRNRRSPRWSTVRRYFREHFAKEHPMSSKMTKAEAALAEALSAGLIRELDPEDQFEVEFCERDIVFSLNGKARFTVAWSVVAEQVTYAGLIEVIRTEKGKKE